MTLMILLAAAIAVGAVLGVLAGMSLKGILAQCAAMSAAVLLFYSLVVLV